RADPGRPAAGQPAQLGRQRHPRGHVPSPSRGAAEVTPRQRAVAARAASVLLRHPDSDVLAALPTVCAAVAGLPGDVARRLGTVADHLAAGDPAALAAAYAQTFDFRRRCTLYLKIGRAHV